MKGWFSSFSHSYHVIERPLGGFQSYITIWTIWYDTRIRQLKLKTCNLYCYDRYRIWKSKSNQRSSKVMVGHFNLATTTKGGIEHDEMEWSKINHFDLWIRNKRPKSELKLQNISKVTILNFLFSIWFLWQHSNSIHFHLAVNQHRSRPIFRNCQKFHFPFSCVIALLPKFSA